MQFADIIISYKECIKETNDCTTTLIEDIKINGIDSYRYILLRLNMI